MIDIHNVPPAHTEIDRRLTEWARWARVRSTTCFQSPIFRMYQSKARQWDPEPHIHVEINSLAALEIERAVSKLPEKHREALRFCYVWPWAPIKKIQRELALTQDGLSACIHDGRCMLKNKV